MDFYHFPFKIKFFRISAIAQRVLNRLVDIEKQLIVAQIVSKFIILRTLCEHGFSSELKVFGLVKVVELI